MGKGLQGQTHFWEVQANPDDSSFVRLFLETFDLWDRSADGFHVIEVPIVEI